MNTLRINALLLAATLVCAPVFGMEEVQTVVVAEESVMFEEGFEDEEIASENQTTEAPVWYKKRSTQVAGVVAAAYAIAVCTGKVKSPFALMAAFTSLFSSKKQETNELDLNDLNIRARFTALVNNGIDQATATWNSISIKQSLETVMNAYKNKQLDK